MEEQEKYMADGQGRLVPVGNIKAEDKLEDQLVNDLFAQAKQVQIKIAGFKETAFNDVQAFLDILAEKYGISKGGKKGNMSFTSYDGKTKIVISVADFIQFGAQLQIAKQLIDECIHAWSEGGNDNISALVNHAFRVDKNNRVNAQAILGLRRLNIKDEKWQRAMDAITDSVKITSSKTYIRFYEREKPEAEWKAVVLDIAKL